MSNNQYQLKILRKPEVLNILNLSETSLHRQIKSKVFLPSFSLGCRAVGWYEHEVKAIVKARAASKSNEQIKALVAELEAARQQAA